ncbi:MAG: hypothetical protein IT423_03135 [Pirellulaceae bacterium]|nr:hypothetical protein [Pirellulaceae bacterium]
MKRQSLIQMLAVKLDAGFSSFRPWTLSILMLGTVAGAWSNQAAAVSPGTDQPATYYVGGDFRLPFRVQPGGRCPKRLDLLVSRNAGRTWQIYQTATPAEAAFEIKQADEGQYWLKVQTRDTSAAVVSQQNMVLVVDRTEPTAKLACHWDGDEALVVQCHVEDSNLDHQNIQLELRTGGQSEGQRLTVTQQTQTNRNGLTCAAGVQLPPCESFEILVTATDKAGNRCVITERYVHPQCADSLVDLLPPDSESTASDSQEPTSLEMADSDWSKVEFLQSIPKPVMQLASMRHTESPSESPSASSAARREPSITSANVLELVPPARPNSLAAQDSSADLGASETERMKAVTDVPVFQSATRQLSVGYALDPKAAHTLERVELWCTIDEGRTWEYWGEDKDCQSPCRVEVERAGDYGFCIVTIYRAGQAIARPTAGDRPTLIVHVLDQGDTP